MADRAPGVRGRTATSRNTAPVGSSRRWPAAISNRPSGTRTPPPPGARIVPRSRPAQSGRCALSVRAHDKARPCGSCADNLNRRGLFRRRRPVAQVGKVRRAASVWLLRATGQRLREGRRTGIAVAMTRPTFTDWPSHFQRVSRCDCV